MIQENKLFIPLFEVKRRIYPSFFNSSVKITLYTGIRKQGVI